ncbi:MULTISPECIES: hypothetical protein [unclassified Endozoicomonas]|uniref:hypothetical protein n=1 Tax=unclassified Endozoicomonas TaxID=2644528 RepID=UPI003BB64F02
MRSWKVLIFAALSVSISGCLSNPTKQSVAKEQSTEKLDVYGSFSYKDGKYQLSPFFYSSRYALSYELTEGVWQFKIPSLEPAFDSKRFSCQKTLTKSKCDSWENKNELFLHVNFLQSDYGDTPKEVKAAQKKEAEKKPITAKDVANTAIAAPFGVAAGAFVGYSFLFAGAVAAPFIAADAIINPDDALERNNWVEFNHEKFNNVLVGLINSEYGSLDNFHQKARETHEYVQVMHRKAASYEAEIKKKTKQNIGFLAQYTDVQSIPEFKFSSAEATLGFGIPNSDLEAFQIRQLDRLKKEYEGILKDQKSFYEQHEDRIVSAYKKQQRKEYDLASTSVQIDRFIKKYQTLDELDLVPKARLRLKNTLAAEEKQRQIAAEKRRLQQQKEQKQLALWRSNIQIGDETFCGPVIDINQSMVKIAVRAQLQGYSNEAWLRRTELFPSSLGCLNRNGTLTPRG